MHLNISEIAPSEFVNEAKEAVSDIDRWVTEEIGENEDFIIIGVWQKELFDFIWNQIALFSWIMKFCRQIVAVRGIKA